MTSVSRYDIIKKNQCLVRAYRKEGKNMIEKIALKPLPFTTYKNNGQNKEQIARYTLTGKIEKADNRKGDTDVFDIQLKSAKATICNGTDYVTAIQNNKAKRFGYILKTCDTMYIMNKQEFIEFTSLFLQYDRASTQNGGGAVVRLRTCEGKMVQWLEEKMRA